MENHWAQPFTFAGVAAFASGKGRLWMFQAGVAALAAAVIVFFFESAVAPVINRAIAALPSSGDIQDGVLHLGDAKPLSIAGSTFLAVSIDPSHALEPSEGADLKLEFLSTELRIRSLFGYVSVPYPSGYTIALNRTELEPWWGAWHPAIAAGLASGTMLGLFLIWAAVAAVYAWPIRLIAFYADRQTTWMGAWRVASGALLGGALFLSAAMAAYAVHQLNLVQLLAAFVLHLMIGWVYGLFAPFCLPRSVNSASARLRGNPFGRAKAKAKNPFAGPRS